MPLNKRTITAVVIITLLSLVGLICIQVYWINKSIRTNSQVFQQKVDMATTITGELFRKDPFAASEIHQAIINNKDEEKVKSIISKFIDSSFARCNLPLNYTFGIYKHGSNHSNTLVAGDATELVINNSHCSNRNETRTFGFSKLTCNVRDLQGNDYQLAIFPSFNAYVFDQIKGTLFTSIVFILFILSGFLYTIITIRRQKRLSDIKNDFINNLTHEFKTPIFSIGLASGALRKSMNTEEQGKMMSYVDVIDNEGKRLKNQVDKILQLSLLNANKFAIDKKRVNLKTTIDKVVDSFEMLLTQHSGKVQYQAQDEEIFVNGDEIHLMNVFYNLIDNAIKYTHNHPLIKITAQKWQEYVSISFEDNGIGIKKEQQKMIFDKFHRVTHGNIHNVKGFGIGLSYVKEIVDAHQGNITLESKLGRGSIFTVNLPIV
ncbi:HAMP domain-containing sensor histidine kinase [Aquimarina sp. MMG016]|uniref:sensor histidine kinase n=1 Tax=Aquimarina sp. MMG016 TaxID=2822690 RepID=UPI001B3A1978|nr:HAMP domain-containing sensor histidine kinase [Aquimarina sp. MMG016]MBQ4819908.1 HAMP domain-containing histidine kinase [Aquimarina sp. MMG016]